MILIQIIIYSLYKYILSVKNLKERKSINSSKNVPVSIKYRDYNKLNYTKINEMKINKLL